MRPVGGKALTVGGSTAVAVFALAVVFPHVTGTGWGAVLEQFEVLSLAQVGLLVLVWLAGLCTYTVLMTASLPHLTMGQALTLNLSGSAVSNLVPFGGALGVGLNYAMARSWGFRRSSFVLFTTFTTLWNLVARLALPLLALVALVLGGGFTDERLTVAAETAAVLLAALLAVIAGALARERVARRLGELAQGATRRLLRRRHASRPVELTPAALEVRHRVNELLRSRWQRMSVGMVGYMGLQVLLLWLILHMLHSQLPLVAVFAGYAFERVLSLLVITPGGIGIAQTGAAAVLVALGGAPPVVAAGVLLFSGFTYFLEIPVGAAGGILWWRRHGRALRMDDRRAPV